LVVSTPFDFHSVIPGLTAVNYVADPERWYFLLQIPGLWRVMFLVNEDASDERVQTREFAQSLMAGWCQASQTTRLITSRSIKCTSG
jgi:3-(3-hydroxy-phenyl)propionate hydroxylase